MKRYNKIWITIEWEDKPLMELHLTMIMIMYCLWIILLLSWILRAIVWISPNEHKADTTAILDQLSWVRADIKEFKQESDDRQINSYMEMQERFDEMYQCERYNWQEMWTVSQCEDLREEFLNSR